MSKRNSKYGLNHKPFLQRSRLAAAISFALLVGTVALPIHATAATLQGVKYDNVDNDPAYDPDSGDIPYVNHQILIRNRSTGQIFTATTDSDGRYQIDNIPMNGDYLVNVSFPAEKCLVSNVPSVTFRTENDVREMNFGFGECETPILDACEDPTHTSVQNGAWNDVNTWDSGSIPESGSRVLISPTHTIVAPEGEIALVDGGLCNQGTLTSGNGSLEVCGQPATPGGDIVIFARQVSNGFRNSNGDIVSEGAIVAGNGGSAPYPNSAQPCDLARAAAQCGVGVESRAGKGGNIEIYSTTTTNLGRIQAGGGGDASASRANSIAGAGGLVRVITDAADPDNESENTRPLISGTGGSVCGNTGWSIQAGAAGDIDAMFTVLEDRWVGSAGGTSQINLPPPPRPVLRGDPIHLKAKSSFNVSGFSVFDLYTDAGGTIDLTALQAGAISVETIRIQTKALNGEGGSLDLRGLTGKVFNASTKVEIYADNILLDSGVDIRDLIDSPEISISAGRLAHFVGLTTTSLLKGEPSENIEASVRISNMGSKSDTYRFEVTSAKGLLLGTLPSVSLEAFETKTVNLPITMPQQRGLIDDITIVAISQTDASVKHEITLTVVVEPGEDKDGDGYPDSLDAFVNNASEWRDVDNDGIGDNADTDDDNDTMPDTWEMTYLQGLNPIVDDASDDFDQDGFTNLEEFQASTDPTDANSQPVVAIPKVDLWIADPSPDDGREPGTVSRIYRSPSVWIRNEEDGGSRYQNVRYGQDNFVYVKVDNIGDLTAKNSTVEVYRSGSSMGQSWPRGWALVGTAKVDELEAQDSTIVTIPWAKDDIPNPGHYCFYVRVLNDEDPMFAAETTNMVQNARTNNNVAWRNFNVIGFLDKVVDTFEVEVGNPTDADALIEVVFEEPENLLQQDGARAIVIINAELAGRLPNGVQGENIRVLSETEIELLATPAKLVGIPLQAGESSPISMRVEATKPMPGAGVSREYVFNAQEFIDGELVGGVAYAITTRAQDTDSDGDGVKDVVDADNDNDRIPDEWEIEHGLNPLGGADADEDADNDGKTNREEYEDGTDPNDSSSVFVPDMNYAIFGKILDALGNPLAGVSVEAGGLVSVTDALGNWRINGLQGDQEYMVKASKDGVVFAPLQHETGNQAYDVALRLQPVSDLGMVVLPHVKRHLHQAEALTYQVTVLNGGGVAATGLNLEGVLPAGATLVEVKGAASVENDATLRCTLPDLPAGESLEVEITVATDNVSGRIVNHLSLQSNEYQPRAVRTPKYVNPHLYVKGDTNPGTVVTNSNIRHDFTVQLSPFSPALTASDVVFEADLSDNVSLVKAWTDHGDCDVSQAPKILCTLDELSIASADAISKATVFVDVQINEPALLVAAMLGRVRGTLGGEEVSHTRVTAANIQLGDVKVDAVIALDITQSMDDNLTGTKRALEMLLNDLAAGAARPLVALISFRDDVELVAASTDPEVLLQALRKMNAEGGGTCPEASAQAVELAAKHVRSGGIIVLATDAPPYADTDIDGIIEKLTAGNIVLEPLLSTTECPSNEAWDDKKGG